MPADIIILAAIAIFVVLRLRSVLGQKIGHDQSNGAVKKDNERVIQLKPVSPAKTDDATAESPLPPLQEEVLPEGYADEVKDGVKAIRKIDRQFTMKSFMEGARMAFDMVLEAFNKHDDETLKNLLSKDIHKAFADEIKRREDSGETVESTLVAITAAEPVAVEVDKNKARITVNFISEQIQVTRDKNGDVVEGSATDIDDIEDEWVFERDLRSSNPNWTIVAT